MSLVYDRPRNFSGPDIPPLVYGTDEDGEPVRYNSGDEVPIEGADLDRLSNYFVFREGDAEVVADQDALPPGSPQDSEFSQPRNPVDTVTALNDQDTDVVVPPVDESVPATASGLPETSNETTGTAGTVSTGQTPQTVADSTESGDGPQKPQKP